MKFNISCMLYIQFDFFYYSITFRCLYTPNTSPVNSIWSCTNDYNPNRCTLSNRVYHLQGSNLNEIHLINELRNLNNRLECIELQFTKLFKLIESKQFL